MKCRVCGYDLDPNREYCDMCGTKVVVSDSVAASKQVLEVPPKEQSAVSLEYGAPPAAPTAPAYTTPQQPAPSQQPTPETQTAPSEPESEFSWNVYSFPKPKKPENISIEWPEYDEDEGDLKNLMTPEGRIQDAVEKNAPVVVVSKDASQGFVAISDPSEFEWDTPMAESTKQAEKFFTFQKKNEEFQRLLDTEYEKLTRRQRGEKYTEEPFYTEPELINKPSAPVVHAEDISEFEKMLMDDTADVSFVTGDTLPVNLEKVQEEVRAQEAARFKKNEEAYRIQREAIEQAEIEEREALLAAEKNQQSEEDEKPQEAEVIAQVKNQNKDRIEAMSKARELYFQTEGMDDIPPAVDPLPITSEPQIDESAAPPSQEKETLDDDTLTEEDMLRKNEEFFLMPEVIEAQTTKKKKKPKKEKKRHLFLRFLLILILIPLLLETAVVGLRTFAPDSDVTKTASTIEENVITAVLDWANTAKQFVIENLEKMGLKIASDSEEDPDLTDTTPKLDLGALVSKYNKNIKSITESPTLGYESTGEYEIEGLENMAVVDDIKQIEAVYACLVSYNSKWVDYVNEGVDKSCLDLLKADGQAYRSALNFTKVGMIKEEFESLVLGEIRYSGAEYYVFVREQITVTENETTALSAYSWLYRLENVAGEMKILDYTAFKN